MLTQFNLWLYSSKTRNCCPHHWQFLQIMFRRKEKLYFWSFLSMRLMMLLKEWSCFSDGSDHLKRNLLPIKRNRNAHPTNSSFPELFHQKEKVSDILLHHQCVSFAGCGFWTCGFRSLSLSLWLCHSKPMFSHILYFILGCFYVHFSMNFLLQTLPGHNFQQTELLFQRLRLIGCLSVVM